ncbi:MAG: tetratricopeptide repeat protein [Pedobacter sp.]|nr:MAG: tetratricopeptide repeat protein [Pedobacter sp.]
MFGYWNDFYFIPVILQVITIIHALKTGRRDWIYLLIFLPLIGAVIYFFMELLPELTQGRSLKKYLFPKQQINEWERKVQISESITNKLGLSKAYAEQKQYDKAITLSLSCLKGVYSDDPAILLQLARQYFHNRQYKESLAYFDRLNVRNGNNLVMPENELLYIRAQENIGELEQADKGYRQTIRTQHSLEAMYYYGLFLKNQQQKAEAREQFQRVRSEIKLLPKYLRKRNGVWARKSIRELIALK